MSARPEDLWWSRAEEQRTRADRAEAELARLRDTMAQVQAAADAVDARYQALLEKAAAVCNDAEPSEDSPDVSMVGTDVITALRGEVPAPW